MAAPMAAAPPVASAANIDAEELKRRTEFLKAQRDKVRGGRCDITERIQLLERLVDLQLLAMKKEEREKQLEEAERQQMKSRPKSARAARSAFGM